MGSLEVCYKTDVGKKRSVNEDSLVAKRLGDVYLLAVADGLGGHAAGEVASRVGLIELEESLKNSLSAEKVIEALKGAITKANREIYLLSKENADYRGMGSTLVVAVVVGNKAVIANVGDSRVYLVGNAIERITKDHSLVQELIDKQVITEEETFDHPQKNIVTRSLGLEEEVTPDFYEVELGRKTLLLCSDGLSDALRDDEIRDIITASSSLDEACTKLIDSANQKGGADNITVVLAKVAGQVH